MVVLLEYRFLLGEDEGLEALDDDSWVATADADVDLDALEDVHLQDDTAVAVLDVVVVAAAAAMTKAVFAVAVAAAKGTES